MPSLTTTAVQVTLSFLREDAFILRAAGGGVAGANAVPAAREAADYVTQQDNNHDGIEEVIRKFML